VCVSMYVCMYVYVYVSSLIDISLFDIIHCVCVCVCVCMYSLLIV